MRQNMKFFLPVLLAAALMAILSACSSNILPPKETESVLHEARPMATPTPMPSPFQGKILDVEVNQALSFAADRDSGTLTPLKNLVSRRSTAVFVRLDSSLGHRPDERDYLELYRDGELLNTFLPSEMSTEDCLCYLLTGEDAAALTEGEYALRAVADEASASRGFTLTDTRGLRVLMIPIRANLGEITYPLEGWQNSLDLLRACFPIPDDGLRSVKAPGIDLSDERFDLRQESGLWNAWEALRERAGMLGEYDLVVGYVRGALGENGKYDCFGRDGILLLNMEQAAPQATLCHYAAQRFGVGDEYEGGLLSLNINPAPYSTAGTDRVTGETAVSECKGVKKASAGGFACAGSLVAPEQVLLDIPGNRLLEGAACFMGSPEESDEHYWISSDVWNALFAALTAPEPDIALTLPEGSSHRLRITGLADPEGGFTLQGSMTVPDDAPGLTPLQDSGSYLLLVLGGEGREDENGVKTYDKVLYRIYFEPDMLCPMDPPTQSHTVPFDLSIPMPEGAKELRILRSADEYNEEAAPMYACTVSPTAPVSRFVAASDGQSSSILRVDWTTEDPDEEGEEPFYELYMCYDGVRLLTYRGTLRYAELDMVSLPKPEHFTLLLLSSDGSGSTTVEIDPVRLFPEPGGE